MARRLPRPARTKDFPMAPRVPYQLGATGETGEEQFEREFQALRRVHIAITRPEARCYLWLLRELGEESLYVDWEYAAELAFNYRPDGIEVDFLFYSPRIIWQVQGEFFHFGDPEAEGQDVIENEVLEAEHYVVVNLLESMINSDVDRVCRAGLNGETLFDDSGVQGGFAQFIGNAGLNRSTK